MKLAPIILFCYARKEHLESTVESLKKNPLSSKSDLYLYSDASKNEKDKEQVLAVRDYIKTISGFKSITIVEQKKNIGLAENIISGVTDIVNKYNKVIVLEDDLLLSEFFLEYMNYTLNLYESKEDVISIHGYSYPIENLPEYFFLKGADCWGWATWKRGWDLFEKDGQKLLMDLRVRKLEREFDYNYSMQFTKMLENQISGKNNSWAIRWHAAAYLKGKLTLHPGKSLVRNIGHDGSGTHSRASEIYDNNGLVKAINLEAIDQLEIKESQLARSMFENFHLKIGGFRLKLRFYTKKFFCLEMM